MKKTLCLVALLLALLLSLSSFVSCGAKRDPLGYLKKCIEDSMDSSLLGVLGSYVTGALKKGSLRVETSGTDLLEKADAPAYLKVWFNADKERVAAFGHVTLSDKTYDASVWASREELIASSEALFGSTTLGVDLETLATDLRTSIFAKDSGTAYADPSISADTAADVNRVVEEFFTALDSIEERKELVAEIVDVFVDQLSEHADVSYERSGGRSVIHVTVNNQALSRALRATWQVLVEDRSFCRELREIAASMDAIASVRENAEVSRYTAEVEHFLENEQKIETICLSVDSAVPFSFSLAATVKRAGDKIEQLQLSYAVAGVELAGVSLEVGNMVKDTVLSLTIVGSTHTLRYRTTKDTLRRYEANFSYSGPKEAAVSGTLGFDKWEGAYSLELTAGERTCVLGGTLKLDRKRVLLRVEEIRVDGAVRKGTLELEIVKKEKMPEFPSDHVNLATISVSRYEPIDAWIKEAVAAFEAAYAK